MNDINLLYRLGFTDFDLDRKVLSLPDNELLSNKLGQIFYFGKSEQVKTRFYWIKSDFLLSDEIKIIHERIWNENPEIRIYELASLPIKQIDKSKESLQIEITKYVDQLLKLNEEKAVTKLQTSISQLESRIEYCESKINELVYHLYELTEEEIRIVEGK